MSTLYHHHPHPTPSRELPLGYSTFHSSAPRLPVLYCLYCLLIQSFMSEKLVSMLRWHAAYASCMKGNNGVECSARPSHAPVQGREGGRPAKGQRAGTREASNKQGERIRGW